MPLNVTDKIVVLSSCPSEIEAAKIGRHLVEQRLAACVTVLPNARSIYRWQGEIEDSLEFILLIKSSREALPKLREELQKIHSYQVPEILALPVVDGPVAYLDWMEREIQLR